MIFKENFWAKLTSDRACWILDTSAGTWDTPAGTWDTPVSRGMKHNG